jgi:hypothetical protein
MEKLYAPSLLIAVAASIVSLRAAPQDVQPPAVLPDASVSPFTGQWTVETAPGSGGSDSVRLTLWRGAAADHPYRPPERREESSVVCPTACWSYNVPLRRLEGLDRNQLASGSALRFDLVRKAGTLHFHGRPQKGKASGTFIFAPNASLGAELYTLRGDKPSIDRLVIMSIYASAE